MVSYAVPQMESVVAAPGFVDITFSKYMRAELLTEKYITIYQGDTRITGRLELIDREVNPLNSEEYFASQVRFIPNSTLEIGAQITVALAEDLCSYADVSVGSNVKQTATVMAQPEYLYSEETIVLEYKGQSTVTIQARPAAVCAGMTVTVTASDLVQLSEKTIVLDENGCGEITVVGTLPGEAELVFVLGDTKLESRTLVTIGMPETPSCPHEALTVETHIYWETYTDNGDESTHYRTALEMHRLYCSDCGTYPELYYEGAYYPNSGEISENLPHQFVDHVCHDCGATEDTGLRGDANGDGKVNYADALLVLRCSISLQELSEEAKARCDVDGKVGLSYQDALLILRSSIGLGTLN
jgi:hypothetical protein